jgi:hypothetical protein
MVGLNVAKIDFLAKVALPHETASNGFLRAVDAFIAFIRHGHGEQTVDKYGFPGVMCLAVYLLAP